MQAARRTCPLLPRLRRRRPRAGRGRQRHRLHRASRERREVSVFWCCCDAPASGLAPGLMRARGRARRSLPEKERCRWVGQEGRKGR
ncbi:hypothetical protein PYCCODRAFT_543461 [Trametes coccinea BRFM310]|uniref:Uncharacterized protein n=1 Tax=Trametes coccinea (strain BRFM310) TaxID=1353009 RepID=A0A1Y2IJP2_TRAC3|nr:hypothetical protein PYCCODRAFT_543461 [Trametes coccinea BRFM310]